MSHLTESKLSKDQKTTIQDDGKILVEASVADTMELRWWLLGFGGQVEILEPKNLRNEFAKLAKKMNRIYNRESV